MKNLISSFLLVILFSVSITPLAQSHCQVPCGIYNDDMRFTMIAEHITTIEKAMNQIIMLEKEEDPNYNQIVRWVNNKDLHADELADIVTYYFLAQRTRPYAGTDEDASHSYGTKLELLHQLVYYAMSAKQATDLMNVEHLRTALEKFKQVYYEPVKIQ
ncbi:superoxide dismutase, Ni [bacterium]|nr:superoxide dismutase, Ni [bacterium]MBU1652388.1 superoxide dismutase, Ni [bacterium]MBU1881661.1 superoxide dismutase, Ni [bacterium]